MLNILFIVPSLRLAGAERQVVDLINGLSGERFNIHFFTFENELDQLENINTSKVKFYNHPRRYKFDFAPAKRIARIIVTESIDVVHCTLQIALLYGFIGRMLAKKKVKFIDAVHTTVNRNRKYELLDRILYLPLMKRCDRIIAVCENQRKHWIEKYPCLKEKFITIHNGIDIEKFKDNIKEDEKKQIKTSLEIEDDELVIGMVAGFRPEKGHEYAFKALKLVIASGVHVKLVLIGDGERRDYLQSIARELGIWDNIIWLGLQKEPKGYLSIFDIFLMPSTAVETFSIAMLEALAMNKPVIATDLGGTSEMVIDGQNGFLIRPKNPEEIAAKIKYLIENPDNLKRLSQNTRASVINKFTKELMVRKTEEFLLHLD
ncbi:MAG: glycosyltransferase family 4 protein [Candidatus Brocadia sp.]|nr:glycosyltransferase family 4 protein [Candidatus Brocadia sp.]